MVATATNVLYVAATGSTNYNTIANNMTFGVLGSFSRNVTLKYISVKTSTGNWVYAGTGHAIFVLDSAGNIIVTQPVTSSDGYLSGTFWNIDYTTPPTLIGGQNYYIGIHNPNTVIGGYSNFPRLVSPKDTTSPKVSTPTGVTFTTDNNLYYNVNQTSVAPLATTSTAYTPVFAFGVDLLPAAPTSIAVTGSPVAVGTVPSATWTPDASAGTQTKYQFRWRKT